MFFVVLLHISSLIEGYYDFLNSFQLLSCQLMLCSLRYREHRKIYRRDTSEMRFEALIVANVNICVFWDVIPCCPAEREKNSKALFHLQNRGINFL
jgi:hypothetical protein